MTTRTRIPTLLLGIMFLLPGAAACGSSNNGGSSGGSGGSSTGGGGSAGSAGSAGYAGSGGSGGSNILPGCGSGGTDAGASGGSGGSSGGAGAGGSAIDGGAGASGAGGTSSAGGAGGAGGTTSAGGAGGAGGAPTCSSTTSSSLVYGPTDSPFNVAYPEWGARWFQWAMSLPKTNHPDLDGPCDQSQSGPAWMLGSEAPTPSVRSCTVAQGQGILAMVAGHYFELAPELGCDKCYMCIDPTAQEAEMQFDCSHDGVQAETVGLEVDGVCVSNLKFFTSKMFRLDPPPASDPLISDFGPYDSTGTNCGPLCDAGTNRHVVFCGYYAMIKPLAAGQHTLRYFRVAPDGSSWREVTYNLTVQ